MPRGRDLGRTLAPPVAAWALSFGALLAACAAAGYSPWQARPWTWFDAALYLDVADHGYTLVRCDPHWCGNAGWMPAFPWVTGAFHLLGAPLVATAVVLALLFHAAALVVLWVTFLGRRLEARSLLALLFAAFLPGLVFHAAAYPLSLFALATLLHLWFLVQGRHLAAGLSGAVAVLSYPVGVALPATSAIWLLARREPMEARARAIALVSGPMVAALAGFALDQKLEVGRWNAYLLVQRKYHHRLQWPGTTVHAAWTVLEHHSPFALASVTADQTVLVAAVLVLALAAIALRRECDRVDLLLVLWAIGAWVVPESQSAVESYRLEAALPALALLVRRLPAPVGAVLTAVTVALAIPIAKLYFRGGLV